MKAVEGNEEELQARRRALVRALRSGQYSQAHRTLQVIDPERGPEGFCCLGVACEVAIAEGLELTRSKDGSVMRYTGSWDSSTNVLPHDAVTWYGFADENPYLKVPDEVAADIDNDEFRFEHDSREQTHFAAAELNDDYGFTLTQIGDCFEYTYLPEDWEVTRAQRAR